MEWILTEIMTSAIKDSSWIVDKLFIRGSGCVRGVENAEIPERLHAGTWRRRLNQQHDIPCIAAGADGEKRDSQKSGEVRELMIYGNL